MKKILLSAFACDPNMGSEPYVGWNWLNLLLRIHPGDAVILLTRKHHVNSVNKALKRAGYENVEIVGYDLPYLSNFDHRHRLMKPYYVFWQVLVLLKLFPRLVLKNDIGIIHQCTYNVVDMPGFLWMIPWVKFIWGPIGGGQIPPNWSSVVYGEAWKKEVRRKIVKKLIKYNPMIWLAVIRASKIFVANNDTLNVLPKFGDKKYIKMLETGINRVDAKLDKKYSQDGIFRILWIGQIEPRKGLKILIEALNKLRLIDANVFKNIKLNVVGGGVEENQMSKLIDCLNLRSNIEFNGILPFDKINEMYGAADLFVFTSVQDTSGNVVLEALSNGLPCLAFDHQGVKEIVIHGGGVLVDPKTYDEAVSLIALEIIRLYKEPDQLHILSISGVENVRKNFQWCSKDVIVKGVYDEILN
jgi:glycosyltransferase involved in cell wall biosynthesis